MRPGKLVRHAPVALDQAVSSASNFLLALLVAQSATAADFGRFAIATTVYWLALGALRALIAEPLLILQARHGSSRPEMSAAVGLALVLALFGSSVGVLLVLLQGPTAVAFVLVCLPVLIWQDVGRYCAFSLARPLEALASDALWLVSLLGVGGALLLTGRAVAVSSWVLLWAACAVVPAVATSMRIGVWPALRGRGAWWSRSRRQGLPMLGDFTVLSASDNVFVFLLPLVASFALLGQFKAAQVVNGPLTILMTAASLAALPALARRRELDGAVPLRAGLAIGVGLAAVAGCWGVVLLLVPSSWGELLFGDVWAGVGLLPALVAFEYAVLCCNQGALLVLRAVGEARRVLVARLTLVPVGLVVPLVAAWLGGATLLGVALVLLAAGYGIVWWVMARLVARRLSEAGNAELAEPVTA